MEHRYELRLSSSIVISQWDISGHFTWDETDYLAEYGIPAILVATKLDRVPKSKQKPVLDQLKKDTGVSVVGTSAETRHGIDSLLDTIVSACGFAPLADNTNGSNQE